MKRNRLESEWRGLGIFGAYDPVVESMLLEWEVERQCLSKESLLPGVGEGERFGGEVQDGGLI